MTPRTLAALEGDAHTLDALRVRVRFTSERSTVRPRRIAERLGAAPFYVGRGAVELDAEVDE